MEFTLPKRIISLNSLIKIRVDGGKVKTRTYGEAQTSEVLETSEVFMQRSHFLKGDIEGGMNRISIPSVSPLGKGRNKHTSPKGVF